MENILLGIIAIGSGLFSIAGAQKEWNFFYDSSKAERIIRWFGRKGAKIFYTILGIFLIVLGVMAFIMPQA